MSAIQQSILNKNRKDKFLLVLTLPDILKKVNDTTPGGRSSELLNQDSIQYSIYGTIVPNIAIPDVDVPFSGQTPKVTSYTRPPWPSVTVNFTVDNQYNNYWVLYYWLNLINDATEGYYNTKKLVNPSPVKNINSYETSITVYGLDEYNKKKIQFDYLHAFITGLGEISYSSRDPDEIESSFTFAFGQLKAQLL